MEIQETTKETAKETTKETAKETAKETSQKKLATWFADLNNQVTDLKQAKAELQEANQEMINLVSELKAKTIELSQLSEMSKQIQSCQSIEESWAISAQYIQKFFPASQGALYLIDPLKDLAEAVIMWGGSSTTEKTFKPLKCWAIRRNRPHQVDDAHPELLCGHIIGSKAGCYFCLPIMTHGKTMGILHLNLTVPEKDQRNLEDNLFNEHKTQLAMSVAEDIAIALFNLNLRETLRQESIRDTLTGLFNRRYMEESLKRELSRAEREKKPLGLIMFDIDLFKEFNDLFGHDGGDALLRDLGSLLVKRTRGGDIVSRYGGDEVVIVFPSATLEDTRIQAEKLRKEVKDLQVYHMGKPLKQCTISIGVAAFPDHGLTSEAILKSADAALYHAKDNGRDKVVVAKSVQL